MIAQTYSQCLMAVLTVLVALVQNTSPACKSHGAAPSPQPLIAYTSLGQELHSPDYPSQYPTHTICLWEIKATRGVVKVTFSSFDLEESVSCSRDYLEAVDRSSGIDQSVGKYCGSVSPLVIYSSDSVLTLRFVSEGFRTLNKGFSLRYQAVSEANASVFCSPGKENDRLQNLRSSGEIYSPNYPANYPDRIACTWTLVVPDGKSVKLEFLDFDLKGHCRNDTCDDAQDYVEVRDGQSYMSSKKGRFCGDSMSNKNLPVQISEGRYMWVRFQASNRTNQKWRGFRAKFKAVDLNSIFVPGVCSPIAPDSINNNLKLSGSSGTFSSPNFPSSYPPSMSCTWVITVPVGKRVELIFDTFSTENRHHDSCDTDSDYVEVRDGKYPHSDTIQSSCGAEIPAAVYSHDRYLSVQFVSNSNSHTSRGFKAHYRAVDKESISEILIGVVVGCLFFVGMCICLVCCVKKRSNSRQGTTRPPSNPRQRQQRRQLLPKPDDEPHVQPSGVTYPPHPVGYMPQPSMEITMYPTEPPPPYSEGVPPPYPGPSAQQREQPHPLQQEDTPNLILTTNSTNF